MRKLWIALIGIAVTGIAGAKLPPPSPEAKAKADETKAKSAWSDKVAAYKLCQVQDKVAQKFGKGKSDAAVPPCQDPGPYTPPQAQAGMADSLPVPAAGKPPTPAETKK